MPKKTLSVYADPYAALDHEGRPAHACPTDPQHTGEIRRWVGAELSSATKLADPKGMKPEAVQSVAAGLHEHPQDVVFDHLEIEDGAIELPETPYYLARIFHGELIAADSKTAKKAGLKWDPETSPPAKRLAASRAKAIASWYAQHEEYPPFASDAEQKAFTDALSKAAAEKAAAEEAAKKAAPKLAPKTTEARPAATPKDPQ